jgi:hypothetical protein
LVDLCVNARSPVEQVFKGGGVGAIVLGISNEQCVRRADFGEERFGGVGLPEFLFSVLAEERHLIVVDIQNLDLCLFQ